MRLLLVDDHGFVRRALYMLLDEPDIEIVGEAASGREAVEFTRALQPDVVLMDVSMPDMDGVQATRAIHAEWPQVCIIGLSIHEEDTQAEAMRAAGAMGYVTKTAFHEQLLTVMRSCYARLREELPPPPAA
jgi:DNA-binding NarL/FixJ family response regulator